MANENQGGLLGPAFNAKPEPAASKLEPAKKGACSFVGEVKDLPVGKYGRSDAFSVVVDRVSGDVFLVKKHPSDVPLVFSVTPPPTENQVVTE